MLGYEMVVRDEAGRELHRCSRADAALMFARAWATRERQHACLFYRGAGPGWSEVPYTTVGPTGEREREPVEDSPVLGEEI